jgi:Ca-activated chloride channel family protein
MSFEHSEWLIFLWLALVPPFLGILELRKRNARLARLIPHATSSVLIPVYSLRKYWTKKILAAFAVAFLVLAAAGPKWGFDWQEKTYHGVDIMVALDTSASMLATDIKPTRLERAKREIIDLLGLLRGDRIGLIAFAGKAFIGCPLTGDYEIPRLFLDHLGPDLVPVQGTSLTEAIEAGVRSFASGAGAGSEGKALIIITDGEDHSARLEESLDMAVKAKIKIFTVGMAEKEGAPVPEAGGGFKRDKDGDIVMSRLNEDVLKHIAAETGGTYLSVSDPGFELTEIYRSGIKKNLTGAEYQVKEQVWHERFYVFAFAGFLILLWEILIFPKQEK